MANRERRFVRSLFGWYENIYSCVYLSYLWLHPAIIQGSVTVTNKILRYENDRSKQRPNRKALRVHFYGHDGNGCY